MRRRARLRAGRHQVAGQLGLAVDEDRAGRQAAKIDAQALAVEADRDALVHQPFGAHPVPEPGLVHEGRRAGFQDAGADAGQDAAGAAALEDDSIDAGALEQASEQQAGGPGADDHHSRPHRAVPAASPGCALSAPARKRPSRIALRPCLAVGGGSPLIHSQESI